MVVVRVDSLHTAPEKFSREFIRLEKYIRSGLLIPKLGLNYYTLLNNV